MPDPELEQDVLHLVHDDTAAQHHPVHVVECHVHYILLPLGDSIKLTVIMIRHIVQTKILRNFSILTLTFWNRIEIMTSRLGTGGDSRRPAPWA